MNKIKTPRCVTPGCTRGIGERSITGLCKRCYSSIYSWQKRPKADLVNRAITLRLYESRMNFLLPEKVRFINKDAQYTPLVVLPGQVNKYRKRTKYKVVSKKVKTG